MFPEKEQVVSTTNKTNYKEETSEQEAFIKDVVNHIANRFSPLESGTILNNIREGTIIHLQKTLEQFKEERNSINNKIEECHNQLKLIDSAPSQ